MPAADHDNKMIFSDCAGVEPNDSARRRTWPTGLATKAITRLARFGFAAIGSSTLVPRTYVPRLPQRWLAVMPEYRRDLPTAEAA